MKRYAWGIVLLLVLGCSSGEQATPVAQPDSAAPDTTSTAPADSF